jgi:hypothetical protein
MARSRPLLISLIVTLLTVAVLAMVGFVYVSGRQTRDVPMPAANASPEDVVRTYLEAVGAHDCGTAESLMTRGTRTLSWCHDVATLSNVKVRAHLAEQPRVFGQPPNRQVVVVPVVFTLEWRLFHRKSFIGGGATPWRYSLVRSSSGGPWRIFNQGAG